MVAGAGAQVERCFEVGLVQDDLVVDAPVHVGVVNVPVGSGIDNSVGVVSHLISSGLGTTRFVEERVLVRVLRGIVDDESAAVNGSVSGVLVPLVIRVQARAYEGLEDLVGGCLGPLLACQGQHAATRGVEYEVPCTVTGWFVFASSV